MLNFKSIQQLAFSFIAVFSFFAGFKAGYAMEGRMNEDHTHHVNKRQPFPYELLSEFTYRKCEFEPTAKQALENVWETSCTLSHSCNLPFQEVFFLFLNREKATGKLSGQQLTLIQKHYHEYAEIFNVCEPKPHQAVAQKQCPKIVMDNIGFLVMNPYCLEIDGSTWMCINAEQVGHDLAGVRFERVTIKEKSSYTEQITDDPKFAEILNASRYKGYSIASYTLSNIISKFYESRSDVHLHLIHFLESPIN